MNSTNQAWHPKAVFEQALAAATPLITRASQTLKPVSTAASYSSILLSKAVPKNLQARALEPMLNHALAELIDNGDFDFLEGHCCAIAVRERNLSWHLCFDGARLSVIPERTPDVTISATIPAFLSLVSQNADPDALFFQRQLSIEGDVELGLYVKNLLDALDEDDLPTVYQKALAALRNALALESIEE